MIRRVGVVVSTTFAAGLLSLAIAAPALATPKTDGPPVSGDDRATAYNGNATTCDKAGDPPLGGEIILKEDKPTGKTVTIDPADLPEDFDVVGVVVKGGDAYNVYKGAVLDNLRAPDNNGGQQPDLSHWFVCGVKKTTTTSPSTPPGGGSSSSNPPSSGSSSSSSSTAPAGQGSNGTVDGDGLANTGFSATGPLIGGGALVLIGSGLLFLLRRTRRNN